MRVILSSLAELQIAEAAANYEKKQKQLGLRFLDCVEDAMLDIARHPEAFRRLRGDIRRIMLDVFPWGLLYICVPDGIRILTLIHLHSDPDSWNQYLD
ncbi:MAG: type II toxin-antitoxin system RelE/ParE family toxin [Prosthecobacter sp.]|uniref:type II toxin-antitoxin system RelE/ParE family toxin n=1 Tax=Prosthecobacter sp. TaxID=1965333 RepID=UPI003900C297